MAKMTIAEALKKFAVALGFGSNVSEYTGDNIADILRQMAVKMECAASTATVNSDEIADILDYIAENYGTEEHEPFDLTKTETHATVTFKRKGKTINASKDLLYNGDKIQINATGATGYDVTTLTVNNVAFTSGNEYTVNGHNVAVVATGTLQKFYLARTATNCTVTVTKNGQAVSDADDALTYGDVITIAATAAEGYEMTELMVNGETFVSGETLTVNGNVNIRATAEAETEGE